MRPVSAAHTVRPTNTMAARVRRRATPISKIRSLVSPNILPLQPNAVCGARARSFQVAFRFFMPRRRRCLAPWCRVWRSVALLLLKGGNEGMHARVSPAIAAFLAWRLGSDGAALLSDDGILLVVGTTLPRI